MLDNASPLLASLPRIVCVRSDGGRPPEWLDASVRLLRGERPARAPGSEAVVTRVTDVLIAQAFRVVLLADRDGASPVAALGDPHVGAAVRLVHEDPSHPWTVTELAARARAER